MSVVDKFIRLYTWKDNYQILRIVQGEVNSRIISIQLFGTTAPVNLTDCNVLFYSEKPDSTVVYVECSIVNANDGRIEVVLHEQLAAVDGEARCWIQVLGKNGEDLRFDGLTLVVGNCSIEKNIRSSNVFVALEEALVTSRQLIERLEAIKVSAENSESTYNELLIDVRELSDELETTLQSSLEMYNKLKEDMENMAESELYVKKSDVCSSVTSDGAEPVTGSAVATYVTEQLAAVTNLEEVMF